MTPEPRLAAVIVNHNSGGTVLTTIRALKQQTRALDSITVVDNGSSDSTPDQIRDQLPDVHLIRLAENAGLSRARNIGLGQCDADLVLLLDDDVYLEARAVEFMLAARAQLGAAVVCPRLVMNSGAVQCDAAAIHFCGMLSLLNAGASAESARAPFAAQAFIGACLLLDQERLRGLGGFDEDFFFYFEDLELSYRLRALGFVIACHPRAVAIHDRGEGTPGLAFRGAGPYPTRRAYYVLRHRWLTMLLHFQLRTLFLLLPALSLYEMASVVECVRRHWIGQWLGACAWMWLHLPAILRRRRKWQSLRRLPDSDILSGGPLPFSSGFIEGGIAARLIRGLDRILNSYWDTLQKWHWISPS